MRTVLVLCYLGSLAVIPHLLLLKKGPTATLAWLWVIIFIPFAGASLYCLVGTDRLKRRRLKHRARFMPHGFGRKSPDSDTDGLTAILVRSLPVSDRQFLQLLSRINQLPASSAETLRILADAKEFYPALERRILQAKHHVHLEFYLWRDDDTGRRFLRLLTEMARRGVAVRLLLDGVGSFGLHRRSLKEFRTAGGEFAWFQGLDPKRGRFVLNLRDHRKLQIIDGVTDFVGGMNIGREYEGLDSNYRYWRDVQMEVTGSVVRALHEVFADDWYFATRRKIPERPVAVSAAVHPVHLVVGGADRPNEPMSKSVVSLLHEATRRVWIASGYFVPDDVLLSALELAANRGVDVRLLVAGGHNHPFLVIAGRSYYEQLLKAGVRIFEYTTGTHHAKMMMVDEQWGMIGSANLDYRSMRLNFELNLVFHSREHNAQLANLLEGDFSRCQEIDSVEFAHRPFRRRLAEAALRTLSPVL